MNSSQELNTDAMQWAYDHATDLGALDSGVAKAPCSSLCLAFDGSNDSQVNLGDSSLSHAGYHYDAEMNLHGFSPRLDDWKGPSLYTPSSLGAPENVTKDSASAVGQKIDLNDPGTLDLYTKCVRLQENPDKSVLSIIGLSREQQGILCQIAHHLNLDYEYQRNNSEARVSKETENVEGIPVLPLPENIQDPQPIESTIQTDFPQLFDQSLPQTSSVFDFPVSQMEGPFESPWDTANNSVGATWSDFQAAMNFSSSSYHAYAASSRDNTIHSAASSMESASSFRGRSKIQKLFSRTSSTSQNSKGSVRNRLYDWNIRDSSKPVSPSPGRHGRLTEGARAAMRALGEVGACWKCKIVRKKCDPSSPCKGCQSGKKTSWQAVGCRRGDLEAEVKPVQLCTSSGSKVPTIEQQVLSDDASLAEQEIANQLWEDAMRKRAAGNTKLYLKIDRNPYAEYFDAGHTPSLSIQQITLKRDVLRVIWEMESRLEVQKARQEVSAILYHSCLYQDSQLQESSRLDNLVWHAVRCLRYSLDALLVPARSSTLHQSCKPGRCGVHCIARLQNSLRSFMSELSRTLFRKGGLQNDRSWWLSVFYSLCIQSLVRINLNILISSIEDGKHQSANDKFSGPETYLYPLLQLFEAASAEYDPITKEEDEANLELSAKIHIKLAQMAINRNDWRRRDITSSYAYLRRLFQVDGLSVARSHDTGERESVQDFPPVLDRISINSEVVDVAHPRNE